MIPCVKNYLCRIDEPIIRHDMPAVPRCKAVETSYVDMKKLPRRQKNGYIIMYDLECCMTTGIPFLITFSIFNCMTMKAVYCDFYPAFKIDNGIPVYWLYSPMHKIYSLFRDMLQRSCPNIGQVYLMAYNGNSFDHLYMCNGFKMDYAIVKGGNILIGKFKAYGVWYEFRDLRDYITTGNLADIGKLVNLPKLETKDFLALDYAIRDTAIMIKAWEDIVCVSYKYMKGHCISSLSEIICYRSTAAICYQYICQSLPTQVLSLCSELNMYMKQAYYGGKCDYTKLGFTPNVSMYDIRSMYPAAMTFKMPFGKIDFCAALPINETRMYIATVTMIKPITKRICLDSTYGLIPITLENRTVFVASGHVTTVLTSVDVENAKLDGWRIRNIRNAIVWSDNKVLFTVYRDLFKIKQLNVKNSAPYMFAKIVMNSSIGKFAGGSDKVPHYLNYFAMSYSRSNLIGLKNMMKTCEIKYVIYGDTDSIVLRNVDMDVLVKKYPQLLSNDLSDDQYCPTGEIEETGHITVLGKKTYWMSSNKYSCKGHNKRNITFDEFENVYLGRDVSSNLSSPHKDIVYSDKTKQMQCTVTPFINYTRVLDYTYDRYKCKCNNNIYVGPNIINYT